MELQEIIKSSDEILKPIFEQLDKIEFENTKKVLNAFHDNKVAYMHLHGTTGYGDNDAGRDALEKVFAQVFKGEDAIVRSQFISGTHTISTVLFGILRPGDTVLSINGKPYDTLDKVIGVVDNPSSLKAWGINYEHVELKNGKLDLPAIIDRVSKNDIKLIICQRSRGYLYRDAFTIEELEETFSEIRKVNKTAYIMTDNCYGEFTDTREPLEIGADVIVGSLIKNPGAGIAKTGGYIVGKKELIDLIADRYSAPGLGKEGGASFEHNREMLQGFFMSPHIVNQALKTAIFSAYCLEKIGFETSPRFDQKRSDIVQMIKFGDPEKLIKYCQGIQSGSPIDSSAIPTPWEMPGYSDKVIMASGSFVSGSSIEISCDGPMREPYVAYQQGGLTFASGKIAVMKAIKNIINDK